MNKKQIPDDDPQPPTADAITRFVDSSDDLALELAIYRAFRDSGWGAIYGHFYWDPILEKPRQFDVQGWKDLQKNPSTPKLPTTGIRIAAECKNVDPNFPVIVSRVPRAESESYHCLIWRTLHASIGEPPAVRVIKSSERDSKPYHVDAPVGKSIAQYSAKEKDKDRGRAGEDPYAKWSQSLASCASLVRQAYQDAFSSRNAPDLCFIMPALVVANGALWTVDYDKDGVRGEPTLADDATFFVGRAYELTDVPVSGKQKYWVSHLHLYTKKGFVKALQTLNSRQHGTELDRFFRLGFGMD
jgi:hypothetical protein